MSNDTIPSIVQKFFADNPHLTTANIAHTPALTQLLQEMLNWIMQSERQIFLEQQHQDKGNGFYDRSLATSLGPIDVSVPRVRSGDFRPATLPEHYRRTHDSYAQLLQALMVNGYSDYFLENFFRSLNLPYSRTELQRIQQELLSQLEDFKSRQLPQALFALYIDGYVAQIRLKGRVRRACLYVLAGIDLEGNKLPIGFYTVEGNESKDTWRRIFDDLIQRGLTRILLLVSDDLAGLGPVVDALFPNTDHQLCFVHLERNVNRHLARPDAKIFNRTLRQIRFSALSLDDGLEQFLHLCDRWQKKYPTFIDYLRKNAQRYLAFLKYPADVRKFIYTTNIVENINLQIERIRGRLGGYFQSLNILEINVFLQFQRLTQGRWKQPHPIVRSQIHEIFQLYNLRFLEP